MSKIGSRLIAFVGLALMMCVTACARSPAVPTAAELEKVSLDTRVEVISRLVALKAGREFETLPQVSIATSTEVATEFTAMYRPYTDILLAGVPKENHEQVLGTYARSLSDLMLGVYFLTSDSVLLVDSTIGRAAQDAGLTEAETSHLQMLVLAHELTHALQQQIAGAQSKLLARTDEDAINAYGAVLEGHAMRVQRLVAADLGIEDRISDVVGSLTVAKEYDNPLNRILSARLRANQDFKYRVGEDYVDRVSALGGIDAVWQTVTEPPVRTVELVAPDKVSVSSDDFGNLGKLVTESVMEVYGDQCSSVSQPMGYMALYSNYLGRSTKAGSAVLENLEHGMRYGIQCNGQSLADAIVIVGHHDSTSGDYLLSALSEFSRMQLDEASGKNEVKIGNISSSRSISYGIEHEELRYSVNFSGTRSDVELFRWIGKSIFVEWLKLTDLDDKNVESMRSRLADLAHSKMGTDGQTP